MTGQVNLDANGDRTDGSYEILGIGVNKRDEPVWMTFGYFDGISAKLYWYDKILLNQGVLRLARAMILKSHHHNSIHD